MTDYAKKVLKEDLGTEFFCQEAANGIIQFILDENIRSGEYVGNEYILKKLNLYDFVVFVEHMDPRELSPELCKITVFKKDELLNAMYPFLEQIKRQGGQGDGSSVLTESEKGDDISQKAT